MYKKAYDARAKLLFCYKSKPIYCFLAVLFLVAVVVISGLNCHDIKKLKSKLLGINSSIWERKGGNYTEALAEFQVSAVF